MPIPKETMLGTAVVAKECGQASAQRKQFDECKKPPGICTNLDDGLSLKEFIMYVGPAVWFEQP